MKIEIVKISEAEKQCLACKDNCELLSLYSWDWLWAAIKNTGNYIVFIKDSKEMLNSDGRYLLIQEPTYGIVKEILSPIVIVQDYKETEDSNENCRIFKLTGWLTYAEYIDGARFSVIVNSKTKQIDYVELPAIIAGKSERLQKITRDQIEIAVNQFLAAFQSGNFSQLVSYRSSVKLGGPYLF